MLTFAAICPHPPIIIPSIGGNEIKKVKATIDAQGVLGDRFKQASPNTVLVVSPHGPVQPHCFTLSKSENFQGDFGNFGDPTTEFKFDGDLDLIRAVEKGAKSNSIPLGLIAVSGLDHGVLVPLYYLTQKFSKVKIVPLAFSYLDREAHLNLGKIIQEVTKNTKERIALIASGDLSHCLSPTAPGGYNPEAHKFDEQIVNLIKNKDFDGIINLDEQFVEEAGECGYRSILILIGATRDLVTKTEVLSYEAPFGVGYLVAQFHLGN